MLEFKIFFEQCESEIRETLAKLPKSHRALLRGYRYNFHNNSTLNHHPDSIGMVDIDNKKKKTLTVAAPWNYPREFTMLHEIGHLVYSKWLKHDKKLLQQWKTITKNTKEKMHQNTEELFCNAYACYFAKNCVSIHDHPEWHEFIKLFVQKTK